MLIHLVRKELLDQMLSLRFAIACVVCLLVFLLSFGLMTKDYREAMSTYNMNKTMHRNEVLQITDPWEVGNGVKVDRPLNALSILVRGVSGDLTESVQVQQGNRLQFSKAAEQNAVAALFPDVDFVFIVGIIMSLLALAFAYDAVSGEYESGVLKLLMSYSVPRDRVILSKWLGGFLALIGPFVIAFLAGLLVALLMPDIDPGIEDTLSVLGLLAIAFLYIAAMYSLGILVSCRTQDASTSITVLLLIWVVLILAIPNMSPYVTTQFLPIPSRESVDREKKEFMAEGQRNLEKEIKAEGERTGEENPMQNTEFREKVMAQRKKVEENAQKLEDGYAARVQAQARWAGFIARISPITSFNLAAYDLTAAGIEQETQFVEALKSYSTTWEEYSSSKQEAFQKYIEEQQSSGENVNWANVREMFKVDLSDHPQFEFNYMPFSDRLDLIQLDVLLLVLWNIILFMVTYLSFLRYDIH